MNQFKPAATLVAFAAAILPLSATVLEDWQFDDPAGTDLAALVNSAGSAFFAGGKPQVAPDGNGVLRFGQGVDELDNVFRNAVLTVPDQATGKFELSFTIPSATIDGGDAGGANVGFGMRDDNDTPEDVNDDTDLFMVRLQRQNSTLRLQHRVGSSNTDLENFGVTTIGDLSVRVVADLDSDTFAVFWSVAGGGEKCATNIPMAAPDLEFDFVRMAANTNTTDWGETDEVLVDFLTVATYEDNPVSYPAIEDWQFNDDAGTSLDAVANDAGTANLGGASDQVATDGLGRLVYSQGADNTSNVFRNAPITNPDRSAGRFEMEWLVTSAELVGVAVTGANVGFGMRDDNDTPEDAADDTDLFLVRLQLQNGTLRLQHRVGSTNTTLEDFGVTSLTDLLIRVVADLDADTFSVFWQLGDGVGKCVPDIPIAAAGLEFDMMRVVATTNSDNWDAADQVMVDYLTIRDLNAPTTALALSITSGPTPQQVTLAWPTATPEGTLLESSPDLADPWTTVTDPPTVVGDNYQLVVDAGAGFLGYRLRRP